MIVKLKSGKFRLVSKSGRSLGVFNTRKEAERREKQIRNFRTRDKAPTINSGGI